MLLSRVRSFCAGGGHISDVDQFCADTAPAQASGLWGVPDSRLLGERLKRMTAKGLRRCVRHPTAPRGAQCSAGGLRRLSSGGSGNQRALHLDGLRVRGRRRTGGEVRGLREGDLAAGRWTFLVCTRRVHSTRPRSRLGRKIWCGSSSSAPTGARYLAEHRREGLECMHWAVPERPAHRRPGGVAG